MVLFDHLPIWLIFLLTLGLTLLAAEIGFRLGLWHQRRQPEGEKDAAGGTLVGGLLGLLAFMLAFTTSFALNQYQTRRTLVITDANAIGTTYLRTSFLDEPDNLEAQNLLREYVDLRLAGVDSTKLEDALVRIEAIQGEMWEIAVRNGREQPESVVMALFIQALNEMIDVHTTRITIASGARVPQFMWLMLYSLAFVAFLLTGVASSADGKRNLFSMVLFAIGFSAVIVLIADLDRSQQGLLTVSQQALLDLQRQIGRTR